MYGARAIRWRANACAVANPMRRRERLTMKLRISAKGMLRPHGPIPYDRQRNIGVVGRERARLKDA